MIRIGPYVAPAFMVAFLMSPSLAIGAMPGQAACSVSPVTLPRGLERWVDRVPLTASADEAGARAITVAIGHGVDLTLHPAAGLHYAMAPKMADEPAEYGGMLHFDVPETGIYRVALSSGTCCRCTTTLKECGAARVGPVIIQQVEQ
jgi:hypothetical protein